MSEPAARSVDWSAVLADVFRATYPTRAPGPRQLGREGEHPIVHPDGRGADIAPLWDRLAGPHDRVSREGDLIVGLEGPEVTFSAEVGRGTMEIIVGPVPDLGALAARYEAAMARLLAAADAEGLWVLGHGIQPITPATADWMTPKQRYGVLLDTIGPDWLSFAVTASDQLHVDVTLDELVPVTNLANLLTPAIIALTAHSAIAEGGATGAVSTREARMGRIQAEGHRHGMLEAPVDSLEGWIGRTLDLSYLMHREGDVSRATGQSFRSWLDAHQPDPEAAFCAWSWHEHYIWNSARPRAAHGTVEFRASCQQPWSEHLAAAALGTAIAEAHEELAAWLDDLLGDRAWPAMRAWHDEVVRHGLAAQAPAPGLVEGLLARCDAALEARGADEARWLAPLHARWAARRNPGQDALARLDADGLAATLDHLRVR